MYSRNENARQTFQKSRNDIVIKSFFRNIRLDFRTKFLMTLVISTVLISGSLQNKNPLLAYFLSVIPFLLVLRYKKYKVAIKGLICIFIGILLSEFVLKAQVKHFGILALALSGIFLRMTPGIILGYYAVISTPMSDLIESMKKSNMPDWIIIPVSVMFRFFYSINEDYGYINDAMRMNNLTLRKLFFHPVKLVEYKLVPLLMCSTRSADDVTISAVTRGLVVGKKRSSISNTKLRGLDYIVMLGLLCLIYIHLRVKYA